MSHLSQIKTKITDGDRLLRVIKDLGFTALKHPESVPVYNSYAYMDKATHFADIIISASQLQSSADIGFAKDDDGNYQIVWDESTHKYNPIVGENFAQRVIGKYAELTVQDFLKATGAKVITNTTKDGIQTIVVQQTTQTLSTLY